MMAEAHTVESVVKKLPKEICGYFIDKNTELDGSINVDTGQEWTDYEILVAFMDRQVKRT